MHTSDKDDLIRTRYIEQVLIWGIRIVAIFIILDIVTLFSEPLSRNGVLGFFNNTLLLTALSISRVWGIVLPKKKVMLYIFFVILCYGMNVVFASPQTSMGSVLMPVMAIAIVLPEMERYALIVLSSIVLAAIIAIFFVSGYYLQIPAFVLALLGLIGYAVASIIVMAQYHLRMVGIVQSMREANMQLERMQNNLEQQVLDRTQSLTEMAQQAHERAEAMQRLMHENEQQRTTIRALSIPILPVAPQTIAVPFVGTIDMDRLTIFTQQVLKYVEKGKYRYVVIDITGALTVDTSVATGILATAQALHLLGAQIILTGIRPEVAEVMVHSAVQFKYITMAASLEQGIAYALQKRETPLSVQWSYNS